MHLFRASPREILGLYYINEIKILAYILNHNRPLHSSIYTDCYFALNHCFIFSPTLAYMFIFLLLLTNQYLYHYYTKCRIPGETNRTVADYLSVPRLTNRSFPTICQDCYLPWRRPARTLMKSLRVDTSILIFKSPDPKIIFVRIQFSSPKDP